MIVHKEMMADDDGADRTALDTFGETLEARGAEGSAWTDMQTTRSVGKPKTPQKNQKPQGERGAHVAACTRRTLQQGNDGLSVWVLDVVTH